MHISSPEDQNDNCKSFISNLPKIPITYERRFERNQQGFVLTSKSSRERHSKWAKIVKAFRHISFVYFLRVNKM